MQRLMLFVMMVIFLCAGCSTINQSAREAVPLGEEWALLPFVNNTETPYAAERAESITAALLYARGVQRIEVAQLEPSAEEQLIPDRGAKRYQEALEAARKRGIHYAVVGTVTEWRYKVGLDGEPVVGVTLQVLHLPEGTVLWSGSGSKSGWSRDAASAVAQQVLESLISGIQVR